jgi:hypothetical protein
MSFVMGVGALLLHLSTAFSMEKINFIDTNGMVSPRAEWTSSGNGVAYSAQYITLKYFAHGLNEEQKKWIADIIKRCFREPGLLQRTPFHPGEEGHFGQEQYDNLMNAIVACIITENTEIPRQILWYGIKNGFFYNTDGVLEFKDWMGRFPQFWVLLIPAAYPALKFLMFPLIALVSATMEIDPSNGSGTNLQWMFHAGAAGLGFRFQKLYKLTNLLAETSRAYFGEGHSIIDLAYELSNMLRYEDGSNIFR